MIDAILEGDSRVPRKQRHTAKRVFERLKDEYGFDGQYTIVKDYVRERGRRTQEMFVPLSHAPGHAQCDFGEAVAIVAGVERKVHYFVLDLPHSDGCFVKAYPAETTEAFLDGHVSAFALLGGAPQSILYDNTKLAVARILGDGRRKRTRAFTELQSHYLFEDRFGRPGKGNDKGKVEGMVGYARRNFLVPVPRVESFEALNAHLEQRCLERMDATLRGHTETIGQRMERDLDALLPLPAVPYDAGDKQPSRVSSLSLVRYRTNDYSAPVAYGHRDVLVRGYVDQVVISSGAEVIARHPRSYEQDDFVFDSHPLPRVDSGKGQNRTLRPLSALWPPVFAGEQDVGQELGLDGQPGVFPLSDCFAEMSGIPVNDDGGEQVEPGHAVVLALDPTDSSGNSAACMPPASIPSAISPSSSPSQDQPSIAHSTGAFPLAYDPAPYRNRPVTRGSAPEPGSVADT